MAKSSASFVWYVVLAFALVLVSTVTFAQSPEETTVLLYGPDTLCSGTVIAPGGILTAAHCENVTYARVNGVTYPIVGQQSHPRNVDITVLYAKDLKCPCADMSYVVNLQLPVRATGYPSGTWSSTHGLIRQLIPAAFAFLNEDGYYLRHTAQLISGMSGGGLWQRDQDNKWVLVGVNAASNSTNSNLSVPVYEIREIYKRNHKR